MVNIYKVTCLITNEQYVGITKHSIEKRWEGHCRPESTCTHLRNAIQKYGENNFKIEPVFTVFENKDAAEYETFFIDYFNTFHPNGYNLIKGRYNFQVSDITKLRIGKASAKKWEDNNYRETRTNQINEYWSGEQAIKDASERMTEQWKNEELSKRRLSGVIKQSEERSIKIVGISIYNGKIIKFVSVQAAMKEGYSPYPTLEYGNLHNDGYNWIYDKDQSDEFFISETLNKLGGSYKLTKIQSTCKISGEVKVYANFAEVGQEGLHDTCAVGQVLNGKRKTYHKKFWKYVA